MHILSTGIGPRRHHMLGWCLTAGVPNKEALSRSISFGEEHRFDYRLERSRECFTPFCFPLIGCSITSRQRRNTRMRLRPKFSQPCIGVETNLRFNNTLCGGVNYYSNLSCRISCSPPRIQVSSISDPNDAAFHPRRLTQTAVLTVRVCDVIYRRAKPAPSSSLKRQFRGYLSYADADARFQP